MNLFKKTIGLLLFAIFPNIMYAQDYHWNVNIHDYQYDMTVYAQILSNGTSLTDYTNLEVAAFVGNECRGVGAVNSVISNNQAYYWLCIRVRSNVSSGETVSFKMFDKSHQQEIEFKEKINFIYQGLVGMPSLPQELCLNTFTPGDVNDDGKILLNDATMIINHVIGKPQTNFNATAADFNGDGKVLLNDATMIINTIIGK